MDTQEEEPRLKLEFDVTPVACARPRLGKFTVYTPKPTAEYKKLLAHLVHMELRSSEKFRQNVEKLYHKPLCIMMTFYMPIPGRLIRKKEPQPWKSALPTTKPDVDNLQKSCQDVLTSQLFKDDSQISHAIIRKLYAERPRIEIVIEEAKVDTLASHFK